MMNGIKNKQMSTAAVFLFAMLFTITPVFAAITIEISTPSAVTQGSNIPIAASFVVGTGDSGNFYFTCDQTTSGEVNPEGGYSVSSSTTKTYTFTPASVATYTNCKVSDGGTQSSSTTSINVIAPSTLTISGSPSSTTKSAGNTFTLTVSISNPQTSAITTSYSLSLPSGYSASGDQTSNTITLSASSTTTLSWTVTVGSSAGTITLQVGSNSNAFSCSVAFPSTTTTTVAQSAGSFGSSTLTPGKVIKTFTSIAAGAPKTITNLEESNTHLTELYLVVKNRTSSVSITIESLGQKPADVGDVPGRVYKYINITKENLDNDNIQEGKIKFKVSNSWITSNNIDSTTIALYRYVNNSWNKLSTSKTSEESNYTYFEAITSGFSYFSVAGQTKAGATTTTVLPGATTTTAPTTTTTVPLVKKGIEWVYLVIILLVVAVIILFSIKFLKKEK